VDAVAPTVVDGALARWVGGTPAKIGNLALPGDPSVAAAYPVHAVAEWSEWLAAVFTTAEGRELMPVVAEATARVEEEPVARPRCQLAHRDVSRVNILVGTDGPVVVGFDHARPADASAFTGMLAGTPGWLANSTWLTSGQRPCPPDRRREAEQDIRTAAAQLTTIAASAGRWVELL
jgi:hypothetical protein